MSKKYHIIKLSKDGQWTNKVYMAISEEKNCDKIRRPLQTDNTLTHTKLSQYGTQIVGGKVQERITSIKILRTSYTRRNRRLRTMIELWIFNEQKLLDSI